MRDKTPHKLLIRACLFKIRQIKLLLKKEDPQKVYHSLCREEKLLHMIPEVVELEKELLFLYQLYTRLEKRLMELLEKEKQEIAQELRQIELQRFLKL